MRLLLSSVCALCLCVCVKLSLCLFLASNCLPLCNGENDYFVKILQFETNQSTDKQADRETTDCTTKHGSM